MFWEVVKDVLSDVRCWCGIIGVIQRNFAGFVDYLTNWGLHKRCSVVSAEKGLRTLRHGVTHRFSIHPAHNGVLQ